MVGSLSAGLLLADEAGAHLPSVDDFLPPEILFQGTPFAINRIILIRIVATIVLLVVLGVTAKRAKLIPGRWQGVVEYGLDFVRDKVCLLYTSACSSTPKTPHGKPWMKDGRYSSSYDAFVADPQYRFTRDIW